MKSPRSRSLRGDGIRSRSTAILLSFMVLVITMLAATFSGDTPIGIPGIMKAMANRDLPGAQRILAILWRIRLPRIFLAAMVGASLGFSGAIMQSILGNPLASPFTLGISAAAGFGASLAIVAGWSIVSDTLAIVGNAFAFSMAASLIVLYLSSAMGGSPLIIVLIGMGINYLFSSMTTLLHYFSSPEAVYRALFWTTGSLSSASWNSVVISGVVLILSMLTMQPFLYDLSIAIEGDKHASVVGVDVKQVRLVGLIVSALVSSVAVSLVGVIGFIGLMAPHIARAFGMGDPRGLVPLSAVIGASILVLADIAAMRIIAPVILPIGAVTSILGVAFFFALILSRRKHLWISG